MLYSQYEKVEQIEERSFLIGWHLKRIKFSA
jgi:hypothetical protein